MFCPDIEFLSIAGSGRGDVIEAWLLVLILSRLMQFLHVQAKQDKSNRELARGTPGAEAVQKTF